MTLRPTSELVAIAWLKGITDLPSTSIATVLPGPDPADNVTWAASGFVQVAVVGGNPDPYTPLREPVLSVDCWAVNQSRKSPPYGKANALAEAIANAVYTYHEAGQFQRPVTLPAGYALARVVGAQVMTEPRRLPADPANYAHYGLEIQISWLSL